MRWRGRRGSDHIEDQRGGQGRGGGKLKLGGGIGLVVVIVGALFGLDVGPMLGLTGGGAPSGPTTPRSPEEQAQFDFVSVILADTETTWTKIFAEQGKRYELPKLVKKSSVVDKVEEMRLKREERRKKMEEEKINKLRRHAENQAEGRSVDVDFDFMVERHRLDPSAMKPHVSAENLKICVCVRKRPIFPKES